MCICTYVMVHMMRCIVYVDSSIPNLRIERASVIYQPRSVFHTLCYVYAYVKQSH